MMIDSNIIVYSLNDDSIKQAVAREFLDDNVDKLVFAQQNIFESLRVLTHPKFENTFSVEEGLKALGKLSEDVRVVYPNMFTEGLVYDLVRKYQVFGSEIFDTVLVATALSNGVTRLATDNVKHLGKYEEIEVVNPF